jgi:deoxyribodipyrimidine photo-lyase
MVDPTRIMVLNDRPVVQGEYVLYWMQASQREAQNYALEHAIGLANDLGQPLVVCFAMIDNFPEANERHYAFLVEGLADLSELLKARGIQLAVRYGRLPEVALGFAKDASVAVCDMGYTTAQRSWREGFADRAPCRVERVESDVAVPVETVSDKHEYAARTIRPKINRLLPQYLRPLARTRLKHPSLELRFADLVDPSDKQAILARLKLQPMPHVTAHFRGGQTEAHRRLTAFTAKLLNGYDERRNEPADAGTSHMSMYLHYGHISPVEIALAVMATDAPKPDRESYVEELIVRRELSMNFCHFEPRYAVYAALPEWARKSLAKHAKDKRPHVYGREQLETAQTHDPYWNAAQLQMVHTGFMHNYMRMYWGKKILEWTRTPEEAFEWTLAINNKYLLDGRDPNAFANVAWIYGTHDRPWGPERPIFGLVRYMNAAGLERKFDIARYVRTIATQTGINPEKSAPDSSLLPFAPPKSKG